MWSLWFLLVISSAQVWLKNHHMWMAVNPHRIGCYYIFGLVTREMGLCDERLQGEHKSGLKWLKDHHRWESVNQREIGGRSLWISSSRNGIVRLKCVLDGSRDVCGYTTRNNLKGCCCSFWCSVGFGMWLEVKLPGGVVDSSCWVCWNYVVTSFGSCKIWSFP